ncbi:hypothetical protein D3C79_1026130 [compost metagenome]
MRKVPEHRLATAPVQPHGTEEQQEQNTRAADAQATEQTGEAAGMDQVVAGLGLHLCTRRLKSLDWGGTLKGSDGDSIAHGLSLISLHQA